MSDFLSPHLPQQLSLKVSLNDAATFENFFAAPGSNNAQVVDALRSLLKQGHPHGAERFIYLWGGEGVGATHLLQAACFEADSFGLGVQYLPLQDLLTLEPQPLLEGIETLDLACLDELHRIAGNRTWELALFNLFNRIHDGGKCLLVAASCGPRELGVELPDLQSRLASGVVFHLDAMADADKRAALQLRARARGLELSDNVAQFVLHRASRDMNQLFNFLQRLDQASLSQQRKLTIPFVKKVLAL